jgi:hypothetical protein
MLPPKDFPDAKFNEEVGRLCGAWAFLGSTLQLCIWDLLQINETMGRHVTYRLDAKLRWQMLCELASEKDSELHAVLKANNPTIEKLTADRNLIVHGVIIWDFEQEEVCWVIYKGSRAGKPQPATTDFVIETRTAIQDLAKTVRPSIKELYPEPPSAPNE